MVQGLRCRSRSVIYITARGGEESVVCYAFSAVRGLLGAFIGAFNIKIRARGGIDR